MSMMAILKPEVPEHVPADLVWDHSLAAFTNELDDPFLAASRLHHGPDIFWARDASQGRPAWVITRHALMQEVLVDYEHFSSRGGAGLCELLGVSWRLIPLDYDRPEHTLYRQILNPFFTPRAVNVLDSAVRNVCDSLIAAFEARGFCEFISEFATPFPSYIFLALLGMPVDMAPQFLQWEQSLLRGADITERVTAGKAIARYLEGFIAEQRVTPQTELLKGIIAARISGRPLRDDEILGMLYTLYLGGLDTVYSSLGWILRHLAGDQALQTRLRDSPEDIPRAVDELMRAFSVATTNRMVAEDIVFHGVQMRAGDLVHLPLYLAGRDPKTHENPHAIVLDRRPGQLTFASGPHTCLGMHLARREIRIVLETFLSRFDNIRVPPGAAYVYHSGVVFGVDRLPLTWESQTRAQSAAQSAADAH